MLLTKTMVGCAGKSEMLALHEDLKNDIRIMLEHLVTLTDRVDVLARR